jgi:hypothetical protein
VRNRISKTFEASSGGHPLVISITAEQLKVIKKIQARVREFSVSAEGRFPVPVF